MKLTETIRHLKRRIYYLEKKAERLWQSADFSSNPFAFGYDRTYVWVEKKQNTEKCTNRPEFKEID